MVAHLEADCFGRCTPGLGQGPLEARRRSHVLDGSTSGADEVMVMMTGEILGQLESTVLISALHPADDTGLGQHREVPVGRALRYASGGVQDLGDGQRPLCCGQDVDQLLSFRRIALVGRAEPN